MSSTSTSCPLCTADAEHFLHVDAKDYFRCHLCALRFVDPSARPEREVEYRHYLHHENEVDDPRYRHFLSRLANPLLEVLPSGSGGLDYGCGPGPALAAMLREAGHRVTIYDPFFANDPSTLEQSYDFVTCTEVAEHFHDPAAEFRRLVGLLKPNGILGLMTCFQTEDARFSNWHYRKDPTHVVFYQMRTILWIAEKHGLFVKFPVKDVAIMFRSGMAD